MKKTLLLFLVVPQLYGAATSYDPADENESLGWFILGESIKAAYDKDTDEEARNTTRKIQQQRAQDRLTVFDEKKISEDHPLNRIAFEVYELSNDEQGLYSPENFREKLLTRLANPNSDLYAVLFQGEGGQAADELRKVLKNIWHDTFRDVKPYNEDEMKFRLDRFVSKTYVQAFMNNPASMDRFAASAGTKYYPEMWNIMAAVPQLAEAQAQLVEASVAGSSQEQASVQPFNEAELKWRLDKFASPSYVRAFMADPNAMARLHASSGVRYYDDIMARYPGLRPVQQLAPTAPASERLFSLTKGRGGVAVGDKRRKPSGYRALLKNQPKQTAEGQQSESIAAPGPVRIIPVGVPQFAMGAGQLAGALRGLRRTGQPASSNEQ